jgi:CheY-like chemotaxis protein/HPt (histidine-containing phosphotransfer) domain-containing protein
MSVFDPSLDRNPIWPSLRDEREMAMLRHDVRSALADVADGVGQLARSELDSAARSQVDRIAAAARSLEWLIAQTFGDARGPATPPETDVDRLIAHLRHRFAGAAAAAGAGFRVEMDPGLPSRLRIEPVALMRVLENLVAGALGRGGAVALAAGFEQGEIVFRVTGERPDRRAAAVADDGAALHETGERVARTLADRLDGRLDVVAALDGRVQATLRFAGSSAVAAAQAPGVEPQLSGLRILLAEDNPTNQMVASNMLRALDAEVLICSDGVEALERFDGFPADLVVVDIEMPRLTGLDVIRAIRARSDARANVPIVALTAYAMREHRDRIAAAGANGLIAKPITSIEAFGRALAGYVRAAPGGPDDPHDDPEDAAALPAMDMAVFDDLCRAIGPELVGELMEKVVADLVDGRARLAGALAPFDRRQIEATAHVLISVAGAFGASRLQASARALNNACRDARVPREAIEPEVLRCMGEIARAVDFARGRAGGA